MRTGHSLSYLQIAAIIPDQLILLIVTQYLCVMQALFIVYLLRAQLHLYLPGRLSCVIVYLSALHLNLGRAGCHRWTCNKQDALHIGQVGWNSASHVICQPYRELCGHSRSYIYNRKAVAGCISTGGLLGCLSHITGTACNATFAVTVCSQTYFRHMRVSLPIVCCHPTVHMSLPLHSYCPAAPWIGNRI